MSERRAARIGARWRRETGQAITEYLLLAGMIVSIWTLVFGPLGASVRGVLREAADRMIRVVAGG